MPIFRLVIDAISLQEHPSSSRNTGTSRNSGGNRSCAAWMWSLYPAWGWGTQDSAQALALLKRFGSVTVLNGHIHQIQQKIEGNVTFHTTRSTAYPQPVPGIGIRNVHFHPMQMVVPAGATVTNHDEEPHVVTSAGGQFKSSPALDTDDRHSAVFTKPGTYAYYCPIHPQMTGTIVVK